MLIGIYASGHHIVIVTNIALASIAFILIWFFALSTAITLYAVSRLAEKTGRKKNNSSVEGENWLDA